MGSEHYRAVDKEIQERENELASLITERKSKHIRRWLTVCASALVVAIVIFAAAATFS